MTSDLCVNFICYSNATLCAPLSNYAILDFYKFRLHTTQILIEPVFIYLKNFSTLFLVPFFLVMNVDLLLERSKTLFFLSKYFFLETDSTEGTYGWELNLKFPSLKFLKYCTSDND